MNEIGLSWASVEVVLLVFPNLRVKFYPQTQHHMPFEESWAEEQWTRLRKEAFRLNELFGEFSENIKNMMLISLLSEKLTLRKMVIFQTRKRILFL